MILKGKIALVTGASKGIGLAITKAFLQEGASVYGVGRSFEQTQSSLEALAKESGNFFDPILLDLENSDNIAPVLKEAVTQPLDIVVNNAGITCDKLFITLSKEDWDQVINVNLNSPFLVLKALMPLIKKKAGASVINMSSVVGQSGNIGQANYAASKAGLIGLTKSLALEFGGRDIRVNAVAPGLIETKMTQALPQAHRNKLLENIPLKRIGQAHEVAQTCVFLASALSSYITGTVLEVNGGLRT